MFPHTQHASHGIQTTQTLFVCFASNEGDKKELKRCCVCSKKRIVVTTNQDEVGK